MDFMSVEWERSRQMFLKCGGNEEKPREEIMVVLEVVKEKLPKEALCQVALVT